MARSFASGDYINFGDNAPLSAGSDWTAFAWVYKTSTTDGAIINKRKGFATGSNLFKFGTGNGASNNPNIGKNANFLNFNSVSIPTNSWAAVSVQGRSTGCRCWINGSSSTSSTSNNLASNGDWRTGTATDSVMAIGKQVTENNELYVGRIAEVSLWNYYLTDAEQASLAKGFSPLFISPSNLVFYAPIIGKYSSETDQINGFTGTITGTTEIAHPKIIYPPTSKSYLFSTPGSSVYPGAYLNSMGGWF